MKDRSDRARKTSAAAREGVRSWEEREAKLQALRVMLDASIAEGGAHSDDEVAEAIAANAAALANEGY